MGTRKKNMRNKWISFLLAAAVLLAMAGDSVPAEAAGQQARERVMPENPVHHCTKLNDDSDYTDWSYVYFGSYPQTEITGDELTDEIIGADYDEDGDAVVEGVKYRRMKKSDANNNYTGENYFPWAGEDDYHYFKWERIKWRVLQRNDDTLFVMADKGLDCKCYNDEYNVSITWENCTLRNWLNSAFYDIAFSAVEREAIVVQNVVNEDKPGYGIVGGNNTKDKVYLLSLGEAVNPSYGFCEAGTTQSMSRCLNPSNYAHARGAFASATSRYEGQCMWLLRSHLNNTSDTSDVSFGGSVRWHWTDNTFRSFYSAIVPALHIDLSSDLWTTEEDDNEHEHDFTKKTLTEEYLESPANCTKAATYYYACSICDLKGTETYEDGEPLGHDFEVTDNGDGTHAKVCQRCGLFTETEPHHGGSGNCVTKRRCEVCNAEYGDFDTTVHGETEVRDAKAATCAEKGYTGDTYCKACNAKIETGQAIPATGNHAWDKGKVIKTPSCTHEGQREYICTVCGVVRQETLGKSAHDYETILTKATGFTDGNRMVQCRACGDIKSNKAILHVGSVILNHTSYTYNGKPKKPSVTLKDTDGKVIDGRNYTVTYEGNTKVGNARVTILLKEDYAGAIFRTFEICPEGTSISGKVTSRNRGFQVRWKKRKRNVTGYEVQYSTNKRFAGKETVTKTIKKKSATKLTVQNLKPGKKYYVRVRTYKTVKKKKFCSAWSKSGSVMTGK